MGSKILALLWAGFWMSLGMELSFLVLYVGWHIIHRMVAHKFDPDHVFHRVHDYFTK